MDTKQITKKELHGQLIPDLIKIIKGYSEQLIRINLSSPIDEITYRGKSLDYKQDLPIVTYGGNITVWKNNIILRYRIGKSIQLGLNNYGEKDKLITYDSKLISILGPGEKVNFYDVESLSYNIHETGARIGDSALIDILDNYSNNYYISLYVGFVLNLDKLKPGRNRATKCVHYLNSTEVPEKLDEDQIKFLKINIKCMVSWNDKVMEINF